MTYFGQGYNINVGLNETKLIKNIINEYPNEQSIIDNIKNLPNKYILIVLAIQNNYNNLLRILLRDPNINLEKVLIIASTNGYTELVRLLFESEENKINIHAENDEALRYASKEGHLETVKLLLENQADIHAEKDYALRWASYNGHTETVRLLLEKGANVHAENDQALRYASGNGHTEIVKLLLENSRNPADIHAKDDLALRWAIEEGHIEIVRLLLKNGAYAYINNDYALKYTSENGHLEIVRLLLTDPKVNPSAEDNYSIKRAFENNHLEIVKLLLSDIRVDPYPNDINYVPDCGDAKINSYIRVIKKNMLLRATLTQYRNTIKENETTIQTIRFAPPSEEYPLGGTEIRTASSRFERTEYSNSKEEEFKALYDYCVEEKTLPDINVVYKGIKIGKLLDCIINDDLLCKKYRRDWLYRLRSISHIMDELDIKLNRTQEVIIESLDE